MKNSGSKYQKRKVRKRKGDPSGYGNLRSLDIRNVSAFRTRVNGYVLDVNSSGAGPQGFSFLLNYPGYYRNPSGTLGLLPGIANAFANEQKVFDEYKSKSLTVTYIPFFNQSQLFTTAAVNIDPTMYINTDNDDSALITSAAKALTAQGTTLYSLYERSGQRIVTSIVNEGKDQSDRWGNVQSPSPSSPDPYVPLNHASIKAFISAYTASTINRGIWLVEWDVNFRGVYSGQ